MLSPNAIARCSPVQTLRTRTVKGIPAAGAVFAGPAILRPMQGSALRRMGTRNLPATAGDSTARSALGLPLRRSDAQCAAALGATAVFTSATVVPCALGDRWRRHRGSPGRRSVFIAAAGLSGAMRGVAALGGFGLASAACGNSSCSSRSGHCRHQGTPRLLDVGFFQGELTSRVSRRAAVACMSAGSSELASNGTSAFAGGSRRRRSRRSAKSNSLEPAPSSQGAATGGTGGGTAITSGPAPSAASSPVPPPSPGVGSSSAGAAGSGKGVAAAAARGSASAGPAAAVAVVERTVDGSDSDYEAAEGSSNSVACNIVPFARRQPRALVLDCAYRPINVLTWYKAFHFDYFGKGEVLEYYPPPAVCTTGTGDHPLPAVLRVPQYTADMQDLCSRVACTRRNIMVRDGFCCQYCGSRRDLTLDHVHPVSKGGKETWENLVTACMRCNQKKSDRTLRDLGWKLRRQPKEPTPFEIGIVAGISTSDILRPPPEWEAYIAPYRERLEMYRRAAVEAGLVNLIEDD